MTTSPAPAPATATPAADRLAPRWLLIPVGPEWYVLPLARTREVVRAPVATRLPAAPSAVLGVFNLRGDLVPLLDTAALLGTGRLERSPCVAGVDTPHGPAGLAISGDATALEPGVVLEIGEPGGPARVGERIVAPLDVDALLTPERIGRA